MVEQIGSGIGRIKDELRLAGKPEPEFLLDGLFTVVFKREVGTKLGVNEEKIMKLLADYPEITITLLSKKISISTTAIENNLKKLRDKEMITREGSDKSGYWKIIE